MDEYQSYWQQDYDCQREALPQNIRQDYTQAQAEGKDAGSVYFAQAYHEATDGQFDDPERLRQLQEENQARQERHRNTAVAVALLAAAGGYAAGSGAGGSEVALHEWGHAAGYESAAVGSTGMASSGEFQSAAPINNVGVPTYDAGSVATHEAAAATQTTGSVNTLAGYASKALQYVQGTLGIKNTIDALKKLNDQANAEPFSGENYAYPMNEEFSKGSVQEQESDQSYFILLGVIALAVIVWLISQSRGQ